MRSVFYTTLLFNLEDDRSVREYGYGWEDNIKINLLNIACEDVDWIDVP
jgi:hypothetical protein